MTKEEYLKYGLETGVLKFSEYLELTKPLNLPKGLEEAAMTQYPKVWKKYPKDGIIRSEEYYDLNKDRRGAFIAGAKWDAEQGMTVSAEIGYWNQRGLSILTDTSLEKLGFDEEDKVEIQIRKRDE